jgi:hypothetical protein
VHAELQIFRCPHCTLAVVPCGRKHAIALTDEPPRCEGYIHKRNGQHLCNPASPVYVAENPQVVRK